MPGPLAIHLLGAPFVMSGSARQTAPRGRKPWALLAYLLTTESAPSREWLAEILFSDAEDPLNALSWNLTQLRRLLGSDAAIRGEPVELHLPPGTFIDIRALTAATWVQGLGVPGLGRDLLEGMAFASSPAFEVWLLSERRHLAGAARNVLREAARAQLAAGDAARGGERGGGAGPPRGPGPGGPGGTQAHTGRASGQPDHHRDAARDRSRGHGCGRGRRRDRLDAGGSRGGVRGRPVGSPGEGAARPRLGARSFPSPAGWRGRRRPPRGDHGRRGDRGRGVGRQGSPRGGPRRAPARSLRPCPALAPAGGVAGRQRPTRTRLGTRHGGCRAHRRRAPRRGASRPARGVAAGR